MRTTSLLAMLLLTACAYTPPDMSALHAQLPETRDDLYAPITIGQTVAGCDSCMLYWFRGTPGEQVTVTVRSSGGRNGLQLLRTTNSKSADFSRSSIAIELAEMLDYFDVNGPHAEIVATLPEDEDGIYVIQLWHPQHVRSLTLTAGAAPADDILQLVRPLQGDAGEFLFPFRADGSLAPWVMKGTNAADGARIGNSIGRLLGNASESSSNILAGLAAIIGEAAGREIAINRIGGRDYIRSNSDASFSNLDDMARYLHYRYAEHPQYGMVLGATNAIFPGLLQKVVIARRDDRVRRALEQ